MKDSFAQQNWIYKPLLRILIDSCLHSQFMLNHNSSCKLRSTSCNPTNNSSSSRLDVPMSILPKPNHGWLYLHDCWNTGCSWLDRSSPSTPAMSRCAAPWDSLPAQPRGLSWVSRFWPSHWRRLLAVAASLYTKTNIVLRWNSVNIARFQRSVDVHHDTRVFFCMQKNMVSSCLIDCGNEK